MMNEAADPSSIDETQSPGKAGAVDKANFGRGWKIRLGVLCAMLVLALVGMGLTQSSESGAWEYWLFVVVVYAALDLWRSMRNARQKGQSIKKSVFRELTHWGLLIGFLAVLLFLERREIINRDSASYFALMLLALSCCLAGLHSDRLLLVVGVVLTIMVVAMATLQQFTVVLWLTMIVVVALAAAFFYLKSKSGKSDFESLE